MGVRLTATQKRDPVYKYYRADNDRKLAVIAGRCKCHRITDLHCDNCFKHVCEKHMYHNELNYFCEDCKGDDAVPLTSREIKKIREAELTL